jgi:protein-L-isoaspartate(D-aspartate) O-methyltransferase
VVLDGKDAGVAFERERAEMVTEQLESRGIRDARVLDAMRRVPRHRFVPPELLGHAYDDTPLPIGEQQTISQPYIVALMSEALGLPAAGGRVLEIGTGSGYQAAVLSLLAREVYSIEIFADLAERAAARLEELGYSNVQVLVGDGSRGWPERAPFDRVLSTAATPKVPASWLQQLADGGLLVAPVGGEGRQRLLRFRKRGGRTTMEDLGWVAFVPLLP